MRRVALPDLAFALFLIGVGGWGLLLTGELRIGSAASMGPGYVPRGLAGLILLFGAGLALKAVLARFEAFPAIHWRALALIGGGLLAFMLVYPRAGLAVAGFSAMVAAGYASSEVRPIENAVFALVLTALAVLLFVKALGLPLSIWPE